jgi:WD40 repeat protein
MKIVSTLYLWVSLSIQISLSIQPCLAQVEPIYTWKAHIKSEGIKDVAFSPNNKNILTCGADNKIVLWDLQGKALKTFEDADLQEVHCVAFSPDGNSFAVGTHQSKLLIYNLKAEKWIQKTFSKDRIFDVEFSPNGQYILSTESSNYVELWDAKTGDLVQVMQGRGMICQKGGFSPDNKTIVAGGGIGLKYWEIPSGKIIPVFDDLEYEPESTPKPTKVNSAFFSPDGKWILTLYDGDYNRPEFSDFPRIQVWDLQGRRIQKLDGLSGGISTVFSPDQKYILTAAEHHEYSDLDVNKGTINVWEMSSGKLLSTLPAHLNGVQKISFSSDGKYLVSIGGQDREVKLWDATKILASRSSLKRSSSLNSNNTQNTTIVTPKKVEEDLGDLEISTDNINYYALIISVQNYADKDIKDLAEPEKNATQLKKTLKDVYGFEEEATVYLKDPTRNDIINALDKLSQTVTSNDNLLIFYAGHGYWDTKLEQGYWLPADAQKDSRVNWFPNSTLGDYIRGIKSKHTLLITDACFSGSIFQTTRNAFENAPAHIQTLYNLTSRKAMTSGNLQEVPDKSIFTEYLIKGLEQNTKKYLTAHDLFNSLYTPVMSNTNNTPQYGVIQNSKHEGGDFVFIKR